MLNCVSFRSFTFFFRVSGHSSAAPRSTPTSNMYTTSHKKWFKIISSVSESSVNTLDDLLEDPLVGAVSSQKILSQCDSIDMLAVYIA